MNPYGREIGVSMRCVVGNNLPESRHVTNQKPDKTDSISSDGFTRSKEFCDKQKSKFITMGSLVGSKLFGSLAVNNYTKTKENCVPMALQGWKSFLPNNNQDQYCINNMNDLNNHKCGFGTCISGNWNSSSDKFPREQVTFHNCLKNSMIDLIPAVMTQSNKEQNSAQQNTCGSPFYKKMNCHRKKSNRYQRYGWNPKPAVQVGSNMPPTSKLCEKKQASSDRKNNSEKMEKKPRSPVPDKPDCEGQTTPLRLSNLSLGESIALEKAKKTDSLNCQTNSQNSDTEKEIDWFSYGQEKSDKEKELPSVDRQDSCPFSDIDSIFGDDDDDSCISQEVLDLFTSDDVSAKSKPSTNGNVCVSDKISDTDSNTLNSDINRTPAKTEFSKEKHEIQVPKESTPSTSCNQNEENDSKDLSFLLFIRNNNKKCRPSAKKRQRSKARKKCSGSAKSTNNKSSQNGIPSPKKNEPSHQSGANSIAFILGFNANEKDNSPITRSHSFLVSFSDSEFDSSEDSDNDSDWSEDDSEDLNCFNYPEFSSPLNINVICSVQKASLPQECSSSSTSNSPELDAVNAAWKVSYHVDVNPKEHRESSKKVHFANDESLVTGVAVVENWCRKGPWEECARDRERFKRRISEVESIICPILQPDKRQHYYENVVLNS